MNITASISSRQAHHTVLVTTNGNEKTISIPSKSEGKGSSVNGGELLFLALATCFCNDVYREATKRNMQVASVEISVTGSFGGEGEPAQAISYTASVLAPDHSVEEIESLIRHVDGIAEVHNTLRKGIAVSLHQ